MTITRRVPQRPMSSLLAATLAAGVLVTPLMAAAADADYEVFELLTSCKEGDNVSREEGLFQQMTCNQYLMGFADAYVAMGGKGYCFPSGQDRVAEMRRTFIKWGVTNTNARDWAAADGVLAAMSCK